MPSKNPTPSDRRRGSRAPNPQKPRPRKPASKPAATTADDSAPTGQKESQEILDVFRSAFKEVFTPALQPLLQTVKQHLFNRDYAAAFGEKRNLEGYVVRWSPSRALCYREVFTGMCGEVAEVFDLRKGWEGEGEERSRREVVCIGGGAGAEVVAAAAAVGRFLGRNGEEGGESGGESERGLHVTVIDIADWTSIIDTLRAGLTSSFISPSTYSVTFHHHDILSTPSPSPTLLPPNTSLITLLFTTNELYAQSRGDTTRFLLSLSALTRVGCLLLVLESAGSYSTVEINGKMFPMGMLLDHTLSGEWEIVFKDESRWHRLPEGLKYPIDLENMRYFVRVYRRV